MKRADRLRAEVAARVSKLEADGYVRMPSELLRAARELSIPMRSLQTRLVNRGTKIKKWIRLRKAVELWVTREEMKAASTLEGLRPRGVDEEG
jgi:hypothetical protein